MAKYNGTFEEDDYGNIAFDFADGTYAVVHWIPFGELGDGQGGEYTEEDIETDTTIPPAELVKLAHAHVGRHSGSIRETA